MNLCEDGWVFPEILDSKRREKRGSLGYAYQTLDVQTGETVDYFAALLHTAIELTENLRIRPFNIFVKGVLPKESLVYQSKEEVKDSLWSLKIEISSGTACLMNNRIASGTILFSLSYQTSSDSKKSLSMRASQRLFLTPAQSQELAFELAKFLRWTIPKTYGPYDGIYFKFNKFANISTSDGMYSALAPYQARRDKTFLLFWESSLTL